MQNELETVGDVKLLQNRQQCDAVHERTLQYSRQVAYFLCQLETVISVA